MLNFTKLLNFFVPTNSHSIKKKLNFMLISHQTVDEIKNIVINFNPIGIMILQKISK